MSIITEVHFDSYPIFLYQTILLIQIFEEICPWGLWSNQSKLRQITSLCLWSNIMSPWWRWNPNIINLKELTGNYVPELTKHLFQYLLYWKSYSFFLVILIKHSKPTMFVPNKIQHKFFFAWIWFLCEYISKILVTLNIIRNQSVTDYIGHTNNFGYNLSSYVKVDM